MLFFAGGYRIKQESIRIYILIFSILIIIWAILILVIPGPNIPTNVVAVNGVDQSTVSFQGKGDSFIVTSSPGGKQTIGKSSPIVVKGLDQGTSYTFTVIARNFFGSSASSLPSNSITHIPLIPTIKFPFIIGFGPIQFVWNEWV